MHGYALPTVVSKYKKEHSSSSSFSGTTKDDDDVKKSLVRLGVEDDLGAAQIIAAIRAVEPTATNAEILDLAAVKMREVGVPKKNWAALLPAALPPSFAGEAFRIYRERRAAGAAAAEQGRRAEAIRRAAVRAEQAEIDLDEAIWAELPVADRKAKAAALLPEIRAKYPRLSPAQHDEQAERAAFQAHAAERRKR